MKLIRSIINQIDNKNPNSALDNNNNSSNGQHSNYSINDHCKPLKGKEYNVITEV